MKLSSVEESQEDGLAGSMASEAWPQMQVPRDFIDYFHQRIGNINSIRQMLIYENEAKATTSFKGIEVVIT